MKMYGVGYDEHGAAYPVGQVVKVGDRVRLIGDNEGGKYGRAGDTGSVLRVDVKDALVRFDTFKLNGSGDWFVKLNNLELLPARPEPKFKVGDEIRVVASGRTDDSDGSWHCAEIGDTDLIIGFDGDRVEGNDWFYLPKEIELVPPSFSLNTRLRLKRHTATLAAGDIVVVSEVDGFGVYATCVNGRSHYIVNDAVEAAPKPKFKAGDRVRSLKFPQYVYTIARVKTEYSPGEPYDGPTAYDYASTTGWDLESSIELDPAAPPPLPRPNPPSSP